MTSRARDESISPGAFIPAARQKSSKSAPEMFALDQTATSLSPCSPSMNAWTLRLSTPSLRPRRHLTRAVSRTVPEPMTRSGGNPESESAYPVRMSTGFATTSRIASRLTRVSCSRMLRSISREIPRWSIFGHPTGLICSGFRFRFFLFSYCMSAPCW